MVIFHPNTSKNTTNNNVRSLKVDDWSNAHHVTIPSAVKQEAVWLSRDFILTNRKHFHLNFLKKWPPGPTGWTVETIKSSRWDWTRDGHVTEITSEMLQKVRVAVGGGGENVSAKGKNCWDDRWLVGGNHLPRTCSIACTCSQNGTKSSCVDWLLSL